MFVIGRKRECRRIRGRLSEYIDDRLGIEEKDWIEGHLETCSDCKKELETLRMTVHLLNEMPMVAVPRSFTIREADVKREKAPEPRRWGGLRPVPVFAVSRIDGARAGIFDPQRMPWLRPATAVVAAALVLLLMLDFLQVVPHGGGIDTRGLLNEAPTPAWMAPSVGVEQDSAKLGEGGLDEPPAMPAPIASPCATPDDTVPGSSSEVFYSVERAEGTERGWPMRQLEIAAGTLFVAMVGVILFTWRQRRKWSRV